MDTEKKCPRCNTEGMERTSRPMLVKVLLFWLPLKAYRCYNCMARILSLR